MPVVGKQNNRRWHGRLAAGLSMLMMILAGAAAAQDYTTYDRFPESSIEERRVETDAVYRLPLGRMQQADGGGSQPERAERLSGRLTRITYSIPETYDPQEVFRFFREQLLEGGQRMLFQCQGSRCGSSSYWANDVFDKRILYGRDENQYYLASSFQSVGAEEPVSGYAALYVIRRVNGDLYAHLDFLEPRDQAATAISATPQALLQQLRERGGVVLRNIRFGEQDRIIEDSGVDVLVRVLQMETLLQVYLVGHLQGDQPLETLVERSEQRAGNLRDRLVDEGVASDRLTARGVGPLAPICSTGSCAQRMEMVLR